MRVFGPLTVVLTVACSQSLDGFSGGEGPGGADGGGNTGGGLTLKTQANGGGTNVGELVVTSGAPIEDGDLVVYTVFATGPGTVFKPDDLTEALAEYNQCIPARFTIYTAVGKSSMPQTRRFQLDGTFVELQATLVIFSGSDPNPRAKGIRSLGGKTIGAEPVVAGSADVAGHALLVYVTGETKEVPAGTTLLTRNKVTSFFSLPVPNAGSVTPPALEFATDQCGFAAAMLFKDR